jgi:hypothetical protein
MQTTINQLKKRAKMALLELRIAGSMKKIYNYIK